jgi:hypothetical protein
MAVRAIVAAILTFIDLALFVLAIRELFRALGRKRSGEEWWTDKRLGNLRNYVLLWVAVLVIGVLTDLVVNL